MRKRPFTYEEFKSIYSRVPRLTVDLIIKSGESVLLTLRESDGWEGQWHFPGGTVYLGQSIEDTIHRIAKEELGSEIAKFQFVGYIEYLSEKEKRGYGYSTSLAFVCEIKTNNIVLDSKASKYNYFEKIPEKIIEEQGIFLKENKILK